VAANPKPLRQRCGVAGIGHIQQRLKSRFILRRDTVCGPLPRLEAGTVFADIVRTQKEVTSLGLHWMSQFIDIIALSGEPGWDRTNDHLIKSQVIGQCAAQSDKLRHAAEHPLTND
jgi:hypothetical protein